MNTVGFVDAGPTHDAGTEPCWVRAAMASKPPPPPPPHLHASADAHEVCQKRRRRQLRVQRHVPVWWLIAGVLLLWQCVAAHECETIGLEQPNVTTVYRSPMTTTDAILLRPDCTFETVSISRSVGKPTDSARVLNLTSIGAERVRDYPSGIHTLVLDKNSVHEANFANDIDMRRLVLSWNRLTDLDSFVMPPFLNELELEGNAMRGINRSKLPETIITIVLSNNGLQHLDEFEFPRGLMELYLNANSLSTLRNATFPPLLRDLDLTGNPVADLDYVVLPDSLNTLLCVGCPIKSIVGLRLPCQLQSIDFSGSFVDNFELRQSDVDIFRALRMRNITSRQSAPCSDPEAKLELVDKIPICVISDARFDVKFHSQTSATSSSTSAPTQRNETNSMRNTTPTKQKSGAITIVSAIGASFCVVSVLAFIYRKRTIRFNSEPLIDTDIPMAAAPMENGTTETQHPQSSEGEYLTNDVRIDESMLIHRLPHEEVRIVREIAEGGFGVVYLAHYQGGHVVLKHVLKDKSGDKVIVQKFMDEIRMCARLEHPKIVEFIGIVWTKLVNLGVVIEYMDRGDLCTLLHSQHQVTNGSSWFNASDHLPAKRSLALDVAEALVYLHSFENPIIHRDLKSRNVLLSKDGTAKLSDFGISREQTLDETMTGEVGTVAWISPEVLQGERYRESADIYSFGIFMAELDKCSHPYNDMIKSAGAGVGPLNIRLAMLVSTAKLQPKMSAGCPLSVQELTARCVSHDPSKRPSAAELHYALSRL